MAARKRPARKGRDYQHSIKRRLLTTTMRALRLVLVLHCAGRRGILLRDLMDSIGASRATTFRDLDRVRDAGWNVLVTMQKIDGVSLAAYSLAAGQRVPKLEPQTQKPSRLR
jgi:predicted DNA-binding transcriptional regulator YafY